MKIGALRLYRNGAEFGRWYWIFWWNWLPKHMRYWGYYQDWYDGPISGFGLWFINITWSLPWARHNGGK